MHLLFFSFFSKKFYFIEVNFPAGWDRCHGVGTGLAVVWGLLTLWWNCAVLHGFLGDPASVDWKMEALLHHILPLKSLFTTCSLSLVSRCNNKVANCLSSLVPRCKNKVADWLLRELCVALCSLSWTLLPSLNCGQSVSWRPLLMKFPFLTKIK